MDDDDYRPLSELSDEGLLWLINRVAFHPRGLALAFHYDDDGVVVGWSMRGDGTEIWSFKDEDDDEHFDRVRRYMASCTADPGPDPDLPEIHPLT